MCGGTNSRRAVKSIHHGCHAPDMRESACCAAVTQHYHLQRHRAWLFWALGLGVTAYSLFCPFSLVISTLSLCPLYLSLSRSVPFPPLPACPERGWPRGLACLSLCHVCNLNCGGAKQGWATGKAFHKTASRLWSFSGSCSVRRHIVSLLSKLLHSLSVSPLSTTSLPLCQMFTLCCC